MKREAGRQGRRRRETTRDDCISDRESKVFELSEGGAATAEGRKEKAQCLCDRAKRLALSRVAATAALTLDAGFAGYAFKRCAQRD